MNKASILFPRVYVHEFYELFNKYFKDQAFHITETNIDEEKTKFEIEFKDQSNYLILGMRMGERFGAALAWDRDIQTID